MPYNNNNENNNNDNNDKLTQNTAITLLVSSQAHNNEVIFALHEYTWMLAEECTELFYCFRQTWHKKVYHKYIQRSQNYFH